MTWRVVRSNNACRLLRNFGDSTSRFARESRLPTLVRITASCCCIHASPKWSWPSPSSSRAASERRSCRESSKSFWRYISRAIWNSCEELLAAKSALGPICRPSSAVRESQGSPPTSDISSKPASSPSLSRSRESSLSISGSTIGLDVGSAGSAGASSVGSSALSGEAGTSSDSGSSPMSLLDSTSAKAKAFLSPTAMAICSK
mmetsp:Transcript_13187/g.31232  ORF Transcript_13187/g.31232 Transcript_13187/m.31232 type:complete len:203 (+) Transcript_13187:1514-2122(+)